jgi:hypothetical protein
MLLTAAAVVVVTIRFQLRELQMPLETPRLCAAAVGSWQRDVLLSLQQSNENEIQQSVGSVYPSSVSYCFNRGTLVVQFHNSGVH